MSPIKILLIVPLLAIIGFFVSRLRNRTFYRLTLLALGVAGVYFVIDPDATTAIAHRLNVGRGTDLLLYVCVIAGFCAVLVLYSKLRSMEATITEVVREQAIATARVSHRDSTAYTGSSIVDY